MTSLSFGDGSTFDQNTGQALNQQAQTGLRSLGIQGGAYTGYVAPAVMTSAPARTATTQNLNTLQQAETQFGTGQTSPTALNQVYSQRSDLQSLYNPDGTAKNPNDPKIAGIPTLNDWASKYGVNEEPLLKGAVLNPISGNNPATSQMVQKINELAKSLNLSPEDAQLLQQINSMSTSELSGVAGARTAANTKDYKSLNGYMTQLEELKKTRDDYVSQLFGKLSKSADELSLQKQLNDITNKERNTTLSAQAGINAISDKPIPMTFITGQQASVMRQANLQLQTLAAQKAPLIDQLKLASETRQQGIEALKFMIENNANDMDFVTKMREVTLEVEKTQKAEQEAAKNFALENGVTKAFYNVGGTVYRTADGKAYSTEEQAFADGVSRDWSNVQTVDSSSQNEKGLVLDLASKYADAGISPNDSLAVAQSKLLKSRIYQDQVRGPVGPGSETGVLGLTNQQIDNISPLVTQFQNSPIVQNYNTIGEGYSFVKSLSNSTTNPADDQALIYALAKALDPGSVVREGEYATAQKYAQSMVQSYGKSVTQALSGSGFLSQDARRNIKSTIESRFRTAETSYKNLYSETERRVNLIGGTDKGSQLLNNYGGAFAPTASSSFVGPINPTSQSGIPTQQDDGGFWSKTFNFLFGD